MVQGRRGFQAKPRWEEWAGCTSQCHNPCPSLFHHLGVLIPCLSNAQLVAWVSWIFALQNAGVALFAGDEAGSVSLFLQGGGITAWREHGGAEPTPWTVNRTLCSNIEIKAQRLEMMDISLFFHGFFGSRCRVVTGTALSRCCPHGHSKATVDPRGVLGSKERRWSHQRTLL